MKDVENRIPCPISTESNACLPIARVMHGRTFVNRVLKKREPRFVPEAMTKKQWRINRRRHCAVAEGILAELSVSG